MAAHTAELTPRQTDELLDQFGLDILPEQTRADIRGALLAAYSMGICAAERSDED